MSNRPVRVRDRSAPADMDASEFREAGYWLVDRISEFFESLPERCITPAESPNTVRRLIGDSGLPSAGTPAAALLDEAVDLCFDHALHSGHPKFLGYISSSADPLGALADLLAAAANPNLGKWDLSPVASEIEAQAVRWLAELIGFPVPCGGLMVSGGNMANFLAFIAARRNKAPWDIRDAGVYGDPRRLTAYASRETHTWIEKAADVSGIGTGAIRWIDTDSQQRIKVSSLEHQVTRDIAAGCLPFVVVGTAGSVSTGAVDPLGEIAAVSREHGLWFHVDGAYGAPAACLSEAPTELRELALADSVALDPHKWLYNPLEAACTLVRDPQDLINAFSFHPPYYLMDEPEDEPVFNYYELGMQNSRGFRALKVWLGLRHLGRDGYVQMMRDDITLAEQLYRIAENHPQLEAFTHNLSITTFRFVPTGLESSDPATAEYLNTLNQRLLADLQRGGELYVSNAVIDDHYVLRACVVNFRTTPADIDSIPDIVVATGQRLDGELRPTDLR